MAFEDFAAFLDMGGYGFYVWLAYGGSLLAIIVLTISHLFNRRALLHQAINELKRKQRIQQAKNNQTQSTESRI